MSKLALTNYEAVLFDVDGTLRDSVAALLQGLGDALERHRGVRPQESEVRSLIGIPLRLQFQAFGGGDLSPGEIQELVEYAITRIDHHKTLEADFEPALEALRLASINGFKTALVTSKSARELELFLPRFTHEEYVDAMVCASDVQNPKPHPECVLLACERLSVNPEKTLMVGDSIFDIRAARDAGATPVGVSYGFHSKEQLAAEQPYALLETPEALLEWVQTNLLTTTCPERRQ